MKNKLLISIIMMLIGLSLFAQLIPDSNFRARINEELEQPQDYEPTIADLNSISGHLYAGDADIVSIEGAQYLVNISSIGLQENQIEDISPISGLTNLDHLTLYDNQIIDISPIADLTSLTRLNFHHNLVEDISALLQIINLERLFIGDNEIIDISALSEMDDLIYLGLNDNRIIDISVLSSMTDLYYLHLEYNQISDISPLRELTQLDYLYLNNNQIIDITALSEMNILHCLRLENNQIIDISPLANNISLDYLFLDDNQISDLSPLENLPHLYSLYLRNNQISDISPLQDLTLLQDLRLNNNLISDISALSDMDEISCLRISNNQISDLSPLEEMANLEVIIIDNNLISDLSPLAEMINLEYLYLNNNHISDLNPLSSLTNLRGLVLHGNQITDISALIENVGFGDGDQLVLEDNVYSNPLSLEAIEVHIPIMQDLGFSSLYYPELPNLNAACYPIPVRHAENVAYNSSLFWYGSEINTTYEVYLGTSRDNLMNIGVGEHSSDNTFTFTPELLPDTEYWWRVHSLTNDALLRSGIWHFNTGNFTEVNDEELKLSTSLSNHPNPFNPSTTISFTLSAEQKENAKVVIYNTKGQQVDTLPISFDSAQADSVVWNADRFASGVYFYKLVADGKEVATKKMLLLK